MSRPLLPHLAALVLGTAAAVGLSACGGSDGQARLIPGGSADKITGALDDAQSALADGQCEEAVRAAATAREAVNDMPSTVDQRLRARLREGLDALDRELPGDCEGQTTVETTPTVSTPVETTPTVPPETTPTVPAETVPPETTPTVPAETVPPEMTPVEPAPDGTGGEEAPDGEEIE